MPQFTVLSNFRAVANGRRIYLQAGQVFDSAAYGSNLVNFIASGLLIVAHAPEHDAVIRQFNGLKGKPLHTSFFQLMQESLLLPSLSAPRSITQTVFHITDDGDNRNSGETQSSALRTLEGLGAILQGGILEQPISVEVRGSHIDEQFQAPFGMSRSATLAVRGMSPTVVATETITTFTANNVAGNEARTIRVASFDWTPHIGKHILFTSGAAEGNVCLIATDDPDSAGTDIVRVSPIGDTLTDFSVTPTFVDPADDDTFDIIEMIPIGGVDLSPLQAATVATPVPTPVIQFSDFDTTPGSGTTVIIPGTPSGAIFTRCIINSTLSGPGLIQAAFSRWTGVFISTQIAMSALIRGCLMTSPFESAVVQLASEVTIQDCIFQDATLAVRTHILSARNCGFFDVDGNAIEVDAGATLFSKNTSFGSGITGVGMRLNGGAVVVFDTLPAIVGAAGEVTIGGTPALYASLPTDPINGAGIYPN